MVYWKNIYFNELLAINITFNELLLITVQNYYNFCL